MKWKKRMMALLLAACMVLPALAPAASAAEEEQNTGVIRETVTVDLIQRGSLNGEYTMPGHVSLAGEADYEGQFYEQIYVGLREWQQKIIITCSDPKEFMGDVNYFIDYLIGLVQRVVNDNPRLFYFSGSFSYSYRYSSTTGFWAMIEPIYLENIKDEQIAAFDRAVETAKEQVAGVTDDVEKMLLIHDYLATINSYNWEVATGKKPDNDMVWSAYGVLVQGDAVCQGYALAYKMLLNELGINCITVRSSAMNHMWNLVQVGEDWYHVDVTWDDPVPDTEGYCGHTYFLLSDEAIGKDHYGWQEDVPACTSTKYESGWAFRSSRHPFYYWNGAYYYINTDNYAYNFCRTEDLSESGTMLTAHPGSYYLNYGVLWMDGDAYFTEVVDTTHLRLLEFDLNSENMYNLRTFEYIPTAVDEYESWADLAGLRLREQGDGLERIEVTSSTRCKEVAYANLAETRLTAPDAAVWDGMKLTWSKPDNGDWDGMYEIRIFWSADGEGEPTLVDRGWSTATEYWLEDQTLETCGSGYYYAQVRAIRENPFVARSSLWSPMSQGRLMIPGDVSQSLEKILSAAKPEEILEAVQALDRKALLEAAEDGETLELLRQLEAASGVPSDVQVAEQMQDLFPEDQASFIGGALNAVDAGQGVSLRIGAAAGETPIPGQYQNAQTFSLHLEGAADADPSAANQQLQVPVQVKLPVPEQVNPALLVLLHEQPDGGTYEVIRPQLTQDGEGRWYAIFLASGFSDFALAEDVKAEADGQGLLVSAGLTNVELVSAIAAAYDSSGRLLAVAPLDSTGQARLTCDAACAAVVKVFLLNAAHSPVFRAARVITP